jgi:hypothetical protein
LLLLALALSSFAGCRKPDEIVTYTVAKPTQHLAGTDSLESLKEEGTPDQLLGVIIPQGKMTWFFKLTGRVETVKSQVESFLKFVESIRITEKGPQWVLPEGWEEQPGVEMRYATLKIATEGEPLEVSVIPLPTAPGSQDAYLLSNVNRWRDQLQLEPIAANDLPEKVVKIDLGGTPAWLVNCVGRLKDQPMGGGPFARQPAPRKETPPAAPAQGSLPFSCMIPEGWQPALANSMQLAAYEVRDDDRQVAISVSTAGGNLAGNINRWREQVQLAPLDAATLEKELRQIKVDGNDGFSVALVGPEEARRRESILGVVVKAQGRQWFIKLKGDADLAAREMQHFEEFVQSIRFRDE